ncbi:glycine zipper domain-containing protein [Niveibacterium microcysteis]|nr:glycine zipper domain-containing protein [Niveibacterium microcysteis]
MTTRIRILSAAIVPIFLGSCASMDEKTQGAMIGAAIGCAAGAVLAQVTSNDPGTACAAGAVVGGLIGYQRARSHEIEEAQKAAQATTTVEGAKAAPVQTDVVQVTDKETGKTESVKAFKSVSVDIPLSQVNTADGREAMRKLNDYARKVATDRGETVEMTIAMPPDKAGRSKVAAQQTREAAGKGAVVRSVVTDPRTPSNVQRVTIEVKNPARIEV